MALQTFEHLVSEASSLINTYPPIPLVVGWASSLISECARTKKMAHYRATQRNVYIPGTITTGLVTATRGSNTITGNTTASNAWLSGQQLASQQYFIRIKTVWYPIGDRQGADLIIKPPALFAEDSVSLHSYVLLKRYHALDPDVDSLDEHMTHARFGSPLPVITVDQMNSMYPARWTSYASSGGVPQHVCEVELTPDQRRQIEIYPYPQQSELLYYDAWVKPPEYLYTDYVPSFINYAALLEGVKYKLYEYEANKISDNPQMKQLMLNEKARQRTIWDKAREEIFLREASTHQGSMALQLLRDRFVTTHRDINNAYSQVWSREP
jgi:hypothetical protein